MRPEEQKILVIDDDAAVRSLIRHILEEEGFAVVAVGDPLAALRAMRQARFALVVATLGLGTQDGVALIRQARVRQPGLRALFTGEVPPSPHWGNPDLDDFIAKPFHRRELLGCVFELLQRDTISEAVDLARRCRAELRVG